MITTKPRVNIPYTRLTWKSIFFELFLYFEQRRVVEKETCSVCGALILYVCYIAALIKRGRNASEKDSYLASLNLKRFD